MAAKNADRHNDLTLERRAAREAWPIDAKVKSAVIKRMKGIVAKQSKTVIDHEGNEFTVPNDRESTAAARVIVAAEGQNQADDHLEDKNARLDRGDLTERVGVTEEDEAIASRIASRRLGRAAGNGSPSTNGSPD